MYHFARAVILLSFTQQQLWTNSQDQEKKIMIQNFLSHSAQTSRYSKQKLDFGNFLLPNQE